MTKEMIKIQNEPAYAKDYEFIVARECDGEYWFWGAYEQGHIAERAALEIDGIIFHNVKIQGKRG